MGDGKKYLVVMLGPTGVGKSDLSIDIARFFKSQIISCDSRQFFREMKIGTAAPTPDQMSRVPHHFIGHKSIVESYSCGMFEVDALKLLDELYKQYDVLFLVGGSGLYIDALCKGIDDFPEPDHELRRTLHEQLQTDGVETIRAKLKLLDPDYYNVVDLRNTQRVIKAVEVCLQTGRTYTSFLTASAKTRNFTVIKVGLTRGRDELYERINLRVDQMMEQGLLDEVKVLYPQRSLNALNTVGYRELFSHLDGNLSLDEAVALIKRNSRRYAKRQLTWWANDKEITWFHPRQLLEIAYHIKVKAGMW